MKSLILLAVPFLTTLVSGQASVSGLPSCAANCVTSGIAATGCALTDVHCFCTASQFLITVAPCIKANCSAADQAATESYADAICLAASPPVTLPSFSSLLNETASASSAVASATSAAATASGSTTGSASAAAATSHSSASGRVDGDNRALLAVAAMVGVMGIAFFAV